MRKYPDAEKEEEGEDPRKDPAPADSTGLEGDIVLFEEGGYPGATRKVLKELCLVRIPLFV